MKTIKSSKQVIPALIAVILLLGAVFTALFLLPPTYDESQSINEAVNVIDGDTFKVYTENGRIDTIRLLCIDTPEKADAGYEEAKLFLESLILGKKIKLVSSVTDKDAYGRLLRYVYVNADNGRIFVNQLILDGGYGELLIIPPETCEEMN